MNRPHERGIVLVAVLFAVAIMSVLVVAASALTRTGIASEGLEQRRLATQLALRSGLESAKARIIATPAPLRAYLDGTPEAVDLGNGITADVSVRDAAGLADLNASDPMIIKAVLGVSLNAAEAAQLSTRIEAWRKREGETAQAIPQPTPQPTGSLAEEKPAEVLPPFVFFSVAQLQALSKPEAATSLAAHFTVFNPAGLINPLAAPDEVLLALPDFTAADLRAVKAARRLKAEPAGQGLAPLLERLKPFLAVNEPTAFIVSVRLGEGPGVIARSWAEAVVQVAAEGPLPFRTLAVSGL